MRSLIQSCVTPSFLAVCLTVRYLLMSSIMIFCSGGRCFVVVDGLLCVPIAFYCICHERNVNLNHKGLKWGKFSFCIPLVSGRIFVRK